MEFNKLPLEIRDNPLAYFHCRRDESPVGLNSLYSLTFGSSSQSTHEKFEFYFENEHTLLQRLFSGQRREIISGNALLYTGNPRVISWINFFPLKKIDYAKLKGLGTLAHMLILEDLKSQGRYSDHFLLHQSKKGSPSQDGRGFLSAVGIPLDTLIPFEEYYHLSADFAKNKGIIW